MHEGTGIPVSGGSAQAAGTAPPAAPAAAPRWLAPAGVAATGAGPVAAGLQSNNTIAIISAAPSLVVVLPFFFGVVCPAVWSRKAQRQKAALNVLNTLIGRSPTSPPPRR
ncbi:hypothetical protein ACIPLC_22715 [Kitasatospora sp. NPDC086801]|uniref:hypothetical protein n=1 Tax=Kitasatospora sp. NPDC086801 TaxID=3364066 RepID=UPI0038217388